MPEDFANSRLPVSQQHQIHPHLLAQVARYAESRFHKPIQDFNQQAFIQAQSAWQAHQGPIILDSGCGVGVSTRLLAQTFPQHFVIGVDRSAARLSRRLGPLPANACLIRADLVDFWRLLHIHQWPIARHYVLYPNPYPKASQLHYRWHAHPVWPSLLAISPYLIMRTNWLIYAQEWAAALAFYRRSAPVQLLDSQEVARQPLTAFERKYQASGHPLYQVLVSS
ncbi:tRNA G46 methylase TrmB [Allopseudospirillum japonicum]|uniref:tRNA (guanine(46)-N(7))-methyltransferase n=1 Tax=Allopseudospirillum japonicum TaxID=64971 RepID=A0A1H6U2L3_9GAMM|nr:hypothetical protein [Allopseudospirillum japonicum]SEI85716.1 tRNA G46 methylase TrmB [Allopseudospirillum japonicum]